MLGKPELIILDGSTSAGKSTLARAIQEQMLPDTWLNFSIDNVIDSLPNSILEQCGMNDWSNVDEDLLFSGTYACVSGLLRSGYSVIFDAVISDKECAERTHQAFTKFDTFYIAVHCEWDEIKRRTIARGNRSLEEAEYGFKTSPKYMNYDFSIDTTTLSAVNAAKKCIEALRSLKHN